MSEDREASINGLRDFADWLEQNPTATVDAGVKVIEYVSEKAELVARARTLGGKWEKTEDGSPDYFRLVRRFGPMVQYRLLIRRENVCERVVTGHRTVTVSEPNPRRVAELPVETRVESVPVVEWVCPDSILREVSASA